MVWTVSASLHSISVSLLSLHARNIRAEILWLWAGMGWGVLSIRVVLNRQLRNGNLLRMAAARELLRQTMEGPTLRQVKNNLGARPPDPQPPSLASERLFLANLNLPFAVASIRETQTWLAESLSR